MSKHFKARDKVANKMTKDGLVERNAATGEDVRVSKRQADMDLRGSKSESGNLNQLTKDTGAASPDRKQVYRHSRSEHAAYAGAADTHDAPRAAENPADKGSTHLSAHESALAGSDVSEAIPRQALNSAAPPAGDVLPVKTPGGYGGKKAMKNHVIRRYVAKAHGEDYMADAVSAANTGAAVGAAADSAAPAQSKPAVLHESKLTKTGKSRGLRFADDEASPKIKKAAKKNAERQAAASRKLKFEPAPIPQKQHIIMARPVKGAANFAAAAAHRKIFQHEDENAGTKAAHRAEMAAEGGARSAIRFNKAAPYRKAHRLERASAKKRISMDYRRAAVRNKKSQRNMFSRALQKRKIKKDYAKAFRESQKAAKRAKRAGGYVSRLGRVLIAAVKRHPIAAIVIVLTVLLLFALMSIFSAASSIGGGTASGVVFSTYLASDEDMLGAEAAYAAMEADLQYMLDNYETLNPGFDEYHYELDTISHDPYVLISILSALHDGEWTLSQVQGTLNMLFDLQYILTETVVTEIRTRIETETVTAVLTDPDTGEEYEEEQEIDVEVEYEYRIVTVTLENFNLSHLPVYIMGTDRMSRYALLMRTLGNRPDLFPAGLYPHASFYQDYGRHTIPPEYFGDAKFAEIIAEAEKFLGWPYVWGGSSPATSFDCSGFVSWVLNQTGWNFGRLGALGLYNICTPISSAQAKPGDLVFFNYTYNAPQPHLPTHVGIYVGDGMMIHAGNPIGYASINTTYWQNHFYGFGRP